MALVHNLYIGHFIPEGGLVRFQGHRPVTTRPINEEAAAMLLRKYLGDGTVPETLLKQWGMSILTDFIVCCVWSPAPALQFAADYADQQGATIVDMGSFSLVIPEQLRQSALSLAVSAGEVEPRENGIMPRTG